MTEFFVSAPGKLILSGEHSVVYGRKAVACSLNKRTFITVKEHTDHIHLYLPDLNHHNTFDLDIVHKINLKQEVDIRNPTAPTEETLNQLKDLLSSTNDRATDQASIGFLYVYMCLCKQRKHGIDVKVKSEIPIGAGLGSSAGFSVCVSTALLLLAKLVTPPVENSEWKDCDLDLINKWAFVLETLNHGKPSGIDNSIATYGKAIKFKAGVINKLTNMPKLRILLVNTKIPRSTKDLVSKVRGKYEKYPTIIEPVFDSIEAIVNKTEESLSLLASKDHDKSDCYECFEDCLDMNQNLLRFLGVSHPCIEQICSVCQKSGLHCKLTGAGGGGCVFGLIPPEMKEDDIQKVKVELGTLKFDCWETTVGGDGVCFHQANDNLPLV